MNTLKWLVIFIQLSILSLARAKSYESGENGRIHKEQNDRRAKRPRPTTTVHNDEGMKTEVGNTLYALHLSMDNQNIIDFLIDNSYAEITYIQDNFGIKNVEIKIVSMQRLLDQAEMTQFDAALDDLEIKYDNFKDSYLSYHITYNMLKLLGVSVGLAVDNFLSHLENNSESLFRILKLVNIDAQEFQNTVSDKSEEAIYNLLATGNYDKENVQSALEIANVKPTFTNIVEILGLKKEFITLFVLNIESNLLALMKKLKVIPENLKVTMKNFNIDGSTEPQQITPMPILLDDLSYPRSIAIQIAEFKTVTHKDATIIQKFKELVPYAKILGTNIADNRKIELIPNSLNPTDANYATLWSEDSMGPKLTQLAMTTEIQTTKDYSDCTYSFVSDRNIQQIKTVPILHNRQFLVNKTSNEQVLLDGTPLICFEKLYGVALQDKVGNNDVVFISKYPIMKTEENEGGQGFFGSIFKSIKSIFRKFLKMFKNMFPFNLFK